MEKKILFLTFLSIVDGNGISNKILSQVDAFRSNGCETHLMNYKYIDEELYLMLDGKIFYKLGGFSRYFKKYSMYKAIETYIVKNGINVLYFRYNMCATGNFIKFCRNLKGKCIRVLEIPTYPYDAEFKKSSIKLRLINFIEHHYRQHFKKCFDKIVTFIDEKYIYGVPTIKISNAVDAKNIPISMSKHTLGEIRMIAVANINFWHGYDRIIQGIKNYYNSESDSNIKVTLMIVGDGDRNVKNDLISLVEKLNIKDSVNFIGNTSGEELDKLFNVADLAIGCLACHRKDIYMVKSLKNVEYAMRGLPFIYSELNEDFDDKSYVIKVSPTDDAIDICALIKKYNQIICTPSEIRASVDNLTWYSQMGKVLDNLY